MAMLYVERCQTKLGLMSQQTSASWDDVSAGLFSSC
jgi:hypothetical protein